MGKVHVKVWTCEGGDLLGEVKEDRSEDNLFPIPPSSQVTLLSWGLLAIEGEKTKKKQKSSDLTLVLFIGLSQGTIFAYSPKSASIFAELSGAHSGAICAVQVTAQGKGLFSVSADGSIGIWNVQKQAESSFVLQAKRSISWAKGVTRALSFQDQQKQQRLLLCNQKIGVFSGELEVVNEITGHATDIISAALSPSAALLATCASSDRFCMIWQLGGKLVASIPLECCCCSVGFLDEDALWIEGEDGTITIYSLSSASVTATIRFVDRATKEPIPVSGLSTVAAEGNKVLAVSRGLASAFPVFERISQWQSGSNLLERTGISAIISGPVGRKAHDSAGAFDHTIPVQGTSQQPMNWTGSAPEAASNPASESLVKAFPLMQEKGREFDPASIVETLHQAIKSRDSALLASIISLQDERIVSNTVHRISPTAIIPFLEVLCESMRIGKTPLKNLLLWIQTLITVQVGFFASSASATAPALEQLYRQMEERTMYYNSLVGLMGKLDLVLAQKDTNQNGGEAEIEGQVPVLIFGEGDCEAEAFEDCEQDLEDEDDEENYE